MPNRAWRFRISVRVLMVLVAVAALIFYGAMLRRRTMDYQRAIKSNALTEARYRANAQQVLDVGISYDDLCNSYRRTRDSISEHAPTFR